MEPNFPLQVWDCLVPHAEMSLNLLRQSWLHAKLSEYAHLNGQYNYNATPMAPTGTRNISHDKPDARPSRAPHGQPGWYLVPAMKH